ncbi:hypothetical protein K1T35_33025 [Pseudonocardia sp. DSM 110487]|uniref:hypothetical protein n=1 Tax=Pseudonocardia sp. DSM 110487 TaxID=2865833 RepID=UPI001C6A1E3A|nr:hypothetical protein [Pseudonocardia sp. DSM 110487]QYN33312.1 hypothetical protein K1T35_33025 [Pseudonocardia sp. DSM 110487]
MYGSVPCSADAEPIEREPSRASASPTPAAAAHIGSRRAAAPRIGRGVPIDSAEIPDTRVIRNAAGAPADVPRTIPVADGLDDPRLRDLDETLRRFMAESEAAGTTGPAVVRLAALLLGVAAKDATQVELVAGAALAGMRARLRGESRGAAALPRPLVALLDQAALAWRTTSDADFWQTMAATAARPDGMSHVRHRRELAAWLGVIAELGGPDVPRWVWTTAAEKADLVDALVISGSGAAEPVQTIIDRLRTLTRGPDRPPRTVAAGLAQMAVAALDGVTAAPPPDRRGAVMLRERASGPNAVAREALRGTAHALVSLDDGTPDRLAAHLFRSRLSALYVDVREQLRQYAPRSDADLPGAERHRRLMEVLGPLDAALVAALDRWSATLAGGSADARLYVDVARDAHAAIGAVLRRMGRATDPVDPDRLLFPARSPEQVRVACVVRMVGIELGLEAGEVLLGDVAPPGDPLAGLRHRLAEMREDQRRLTSERDARMQGPLLATIALRPKYLAALGGTTVKALTAAARSFDTAAMAAPPDPVALEAAADELIEAARQARRAGAALREFDRQEVVHLADLLQEIVAEQLARWPDRLAAKGAALRAAIPTLPVPAAGVSLDRFWGEQKAEVLATLPTLIATQVSDAMGLHLGTELGRLSALVPARDEAATAEQAWTVLRILRAYKAIASRLPVSRADAKARLHAALDAVALSVLRLLPPPP